MKKINLKSILKKTFKKKKKALPKKKGKPVSKKTKTPKIKKKIGRPKAIKKDLLNKTSKNKKLKKDPKKNENLKLTKTLDQKPEIIKKTVKKLYPNLDNLNDVITQAEQKENDTNHIQEFTKDVKSLSLENKIIIVETLWRIILSDGKSDIYENNLMRRLAGLLYLDDKILGETKIKVLKNK